MTNTTHTAKHTPGPWVVNADGRMIEAQLPNLRNEYEHICDLRGGIKGQINLGNANLIAAAPAMYEALSSILKDIEKVEPRTLSGYANLCTMFRTITKAALAQAEGRG